MNWDKNKTSHTCENLKNEKHINDERGKVEISYIVKTIMDVLLRIIKNKDAIPAGC